MNAPNELHAIPAGENHAQTIAALAQRAFGATYIGSLPTVTLPTEARIQPLESFLASPLRIRQSSAFTDVASFVFYVNRFKLSASLLFAQEAALTCVAKLDHSAPSDPSWGTHDASVEFQLSREWQTWVAANGKRMDQVAFAEFLENNLPDIAEPAGAVVLEMARTLELKKGVNFASAVRLDNGQQQLTYNEDIQGSAAKGTLALVDTFTLGLPPFERSALYKVTARLRFRLQESKLVLWFDLLRPQDVLRQAWDDALAQIGTETSLPVLNGATTSQQPLAAK